MRMRLGAVVIALTCGAVSAQPRRRAPPPPPAPYAQPQRVPPATSGPANRRPAPPANNPYRNGNAPPPPTSNSNSPPAYDPYNPPYNSGNNSNYDPYTDPRQPPPTPPPTRQPPTYGGYNGSSPPPYPSNGNSPPPYPNNSNSPPRYPNNGGSNGNAPAPYDPYTDPRQPPPSPPTYGGYNGSSPQPYPGNGDTPPPAYGNSNSPPSYPPSNGGYNGNGSAPPPPTPAPTPTTYIPPSYNGNSNANGSTPPSYGGNSNGNTNAPPPTSVPAPGENLGIDTCLGDASAMGGSTYGTQRQRIDVVWPQLPDAYVKLIEVTNGCGSGEPTTDPRYLDDSDFVDSATPDIVTTSPHYYVNFRKACLMHDAGYSGAKTNDIFTGQIVDFLDHTQAQIDDRFYADMVRMCDEQIPAKAAAARENCKEYGGPHMTHGAKSRYRGVQAAGATVAWKGRPALSGAWRSSQASWSITQSKRSVVANWTLANPDFRGEFRGTLISRDSWTTVEGFYVIYEKGVARCQPQKSTWRWEPGKPNGLTVYGPAGVQTLGR